MYLKQESKRQISSVITETGRGKDDVIALGLEFPYCHPVSLYETLVGAGLYKQNTVSFDFFAGSGTTGHAVLNLNREDGGNRKFILVEMGHYFDSILVPRIGKVMYTPKWRDGAPERDPTEDEVAHTPRIVKMLTLESYEDALHNLTASASAEDEAVPEHAQSGSARISYDLDRLLQGSDAMLRWGGLARPFDYSMEVLTETGAESSPVDLVETFNALYGLHVKRIEQWTDAETDRVYRVVKAEKTDGASVLVLWRNVPPEEEADRDRRFLEEQTDDITAWDEVLINGPCAAPGVRPLDGLFQQLLHPQQSCNYRD